VPALAVLEALVLELPPVTALEPPAPIDPLPLVDELLPPDVPTLELATFELPSEVPLTPVTELPP
jgi:hypothetical protein